MARINAIQKAIQELDGGGYQKFMDAYLYKKHNYKNITPLGSHTGTNKVTKGIPDSYVKLENGKYILIMYGTVEKITYKKLESDIKSCLCKNNLNIESSKIAEIICCHTSDNIHIEQVEKLENLAPGIKITLIGIGEVSNDLLIRYPHIAKEFLEIPIDTGQIMDIDKFEDEFERIQTNTSIRLDLLHRENEVNTLINKLESNDVVMVIGKSGVGKTRLTLEVCKKYREKYNVKILCISNKNQILYNDLKYHLSDEGEYLLFVDDANQITQIEHLLEYIVNPSFNIKTKIILTVRDYAQDTVKKILNKKVVYVEEQVNILSDENIKDILEKNLGIKNDTYLEQIIKIAKGNARLSILAGKVSMEKGYIAIHNSADIFRNYYENIINNVFLDRDYIIIAFLVTLLGKFRYREHKIATKILEEQGIGERKFYSICYELHEREIVDLYLSQIVSISDQSMGDYLLYFVLYEKKYIKVSDIIQKVFFTKNDRVIYTLNTLLKLFYSDELITHIKNEVNLVWNNIDDDELEFKYLKSFHIFNEEKTLEYIYKKISSIEMQSCDLLEFDFKGKTNNKTIKSKYIEVLGGFKYSSNLTTVVELLILFINKSPKEVMDVYFTLTSRLGYNIHSFDNNYENEYEIIKELWNGCKAGNDINVTVLLLHVIEFYLKYEFDITESDGRKGITFIKFNLCICPGLEKLRELMWSILGDLYSDKRYTSYIDNIMLSIHPYAKSESNIKVIFEKDLLYVIQNILHKINYPTIRQCRILRRFDKLSNRFEIDTNNQFTKYKENKEFLIYEVLVPNEENANLEEEENVRKEKIYLLVKDYKANDFTRLFNLCKLILQESDSRARWKIENGISLIFDRLSELSSQFILAAKEYIKSDILSYYNEKYVVSKLIELIGVNETHNIIKNLNGNNANFWLSVLLECLSENQITLEHIEYLYKLFDEELEKEYPKIICIDNLVKYMEVSGDVILNLSKKILSKKCEKAFVVYEFLGRIFDEKRCKLLLNIYSSEINILEDLYMETKDMHIDYNGNLFVELIKNNKNFIERYVLKSIERERYFEYNNLFFKIWEQENYKELINIIFEFILRMQDETHILKISNLNKVFINHEDTELIKNRKIKWLKEYIDKNYNDKDYMEIIFDTIVIAFKKQKIELFLYFLNKNNDFEIFKNISLFPMFNSWSGSEVPMIEEEIKFLDELNTNLKGIKYIQHKSYLKQMINNKEKHKQNVLLQEYLKDCM